MSAIEYECLTSIAEAMDDLLDEHDGGMEYCNPVWYTVSTAYWDLVDRLALATVT